MKWTYDGLGTIMEGHEVVCRMNVGNPNCVANTNFIIASKDLLAASVELVSVPNKHRPGRVWDAARAAIAKAGANGK